MIRRMIAAPPSVGRARWCVEPWEGLDIKPSKTLETWTTISLPTAEVFAALRERSPGAAHYWTCVDSLGEEMVTFSRDICVTIHDVP